MVWNLGVARISRVVEHVMSFDVDFFGGATPPDVAAEKEHLADFIDASGRYLMAFQTFVIEAADRRIAVDTGCGNSKPRPLIPEFDHRNWPFLHRLRAAGFAPETIDTVVCTHLHVDHVGWNTRLVDGAWVPTFPHARYLFGAADLDHWARSHDALHGPAFADSV
ncbi:MAG: MBL fold metallo-hydrolase [Frankiaceae bacterium]